MSIPKVFLNAATQRSAECEPSPKELFRSSHMLTADHELLARSYKMAPQLKHIMTLRVNLAPPVEFGRTAYGERRFIAITGGTFDGPSIAGEILNGGGDWNAVRPDGVVHVFAKYSLRTDDGVLINITNEGWGRSNAAEMKAVFENDFVAAEKAAQDQPWYTKTCPRFEVTEGKYGWLNSTCFVGDLVRPNKPGHVDIEVYQID